MQQKTVAEQNSHEDTLIYQRYFALDRKLSTLGDPTLHRDRTIIEN